MLSALKGITEHIMHILRHENFFKKPVFIVGLPRSGSTLWHNIISSGTNMLRIAEMHFLNPWRKDFRYFCKRYVGDLQVDKNVKKMVDLIFSDKSIKGLTGWFWQADINNVKNPKFKAQFYNKILESDRSLDSIFKILIQEITDFHGTERCCIKFPVYPNYIPQLLEWYPDCKILHITRDPRAIAVSRTNDPDGTRKKISKYPYLSFVIRKIMIYFVVLQYGWTSRIHCYYQNNRNYALFRYEDLLVDSERVVKQLCKFIEHDFKPEMLNPQKGQESSITRKKTNGFDKKAGSRWKKVISPFDKWLITFLTRKSVRRFGYNPNNHPIYLKKATELY
jgi:hypothetical protein